MSAKPSVKTPSFDEAHEQAIRAVGELLVRSKDPRYLRIQRELIAMRSAAQVARMEKERNLG